MDGYDTINGLYEWAGGFVILLSCRKLWRDKEVRGVSPWQIPLFTSWGWFHLFFYARYAAWLSLSGAVVGAIANTAWLALVLWYTVFRTYVPNPDCVAFLFFFLRFIPWRRP